MLNIDLDRMLNAIGLADAEDWRDFRNYLSLLRVGRRKDALRALDNFILAALQWPFDKRLSFSLWTLNLSSAQSINHDLDEKIIKATITEWPLHAKECAEMHLWAGLLGIETPLKHMERALELDQNCHRARQWLCLSMIDEVGFNQHHLPDSYFNDPNKDLATLEKAQALWIGHEDCELAKHCLSEIETYRALAKEWLNKTPPPSRTSP